MEKIKAAFTVLRLKKKANSLNCILKVTSRPVRRMDWRKENSE